MKIKIIKFDNFYKFPQRAHLNDAGADVYSTVDVTIPAHGRLAIPLGFGCVVPEGMMGFVTSRSGYAAREGIIAIEAPIDSGYQGQIHAITINTSDKDFVVNKGDRVGQLVFQKVDIVDFIDVEDSVLERGTSGMGSTGR